MLKNVSFNIKETVLLIVFIISNLIIAFLKIESLILNPFTTLLIYSISLLLIFLVLYYLDEYYNYTLAFGIVISSLGIIFNLNNYFLHFLLVFYILLILLKKQYCIDKYSSKLGIAKGIALILSALLFFFVMKPSVFQQKYVDFLESNKFDQIMKKQINYILSSIDYEQIIEKEIKKQEEQIIEKYNKKIEEIKNNQFLTEEQKEAMINSLKQQLNETLKQLEEEKEKANSKIVNQIETSLKTVKETLKSYLNNEITLKVVTISLILPVIGFINTIVYYFSLLISLIIDFIIKIFKERNKNLTDEL
jgi:hypothetical protein